ncbi:MAG: FMN-binding glutamate synthase family protein, partial [Yoonia sp.]
MPRLSVPNRYTPLFIAAFLAVLSAIIAVWYPAFWLVAAVFLALTLLGISDLRQHNHSILRNYPIMGHIRFLLEGIRPEIR